MITFYNQINEASQKYVAGSSGPVIEMLGFEALVEIAPYELGIRNR